MDDVGRGFGKSEGQGDRQGRPFRKNGAAMDQEGRGFGKSERPWNVREGRSEKAEVPWIDKGEVSGNAKASRIAPSGLGENRG